MSADPSKVVGYKFDDIPFDYTEKDTCLYALGVGAGRQGPVSDVELSRTYENAENFVALPTMGVIFPFKLMAQTMSVPGLEFNPMMLLHGEQYLEIKSPIPTSGQLVNSGHISGVYDKGKGALVTLDASTRDAQGSEIVFNRISVFIRGIGGFGGDRGPSNRPEPLPDRAPDAAVEQGTDTHQALIYRWASGDLNPLHADPSMAAMGGFDKPILHGLCTFGFAGRHLVDAMLNGDVARFKSINVRFAKHVFPGDTVRTEMWRVSPTKVLFQVKVVERDVVVISNGILTNTPAQSKL
jgi:acyl dehydratase